jgi:hypothetical protein
VFNGADRIDRNGTIDQISINLCTVPTSNEAKIQLFIIQAKSDKPGPFQVREHTPSLTNLQEYV